VVGHILTQHQSPGDIVARYGGDEFVMILKNTSLEAAKNRAELVRTSILAYPFRDEEYLAGGDVTASFGVAAFTDDVEDSDDLMRRADRALYRAKMEGKNRVRIWEKS
jgi:diguanylate cyclase (GGDEF)-like protein